MRLLLCAINYRRMREPIIERRDPNDQPIMQMALSSKTKTHAEISRLAEDDLSDRLSCH